MSTLTMDLLQGLDPSWSRADPAKVHPELHPQRVEELRAIDAQLAEAYVRWAEVLAGAPDLKSLQERQVAALGRERGVLKRALAEIPKLPVSQRQTRGHGLNSMKLGLEGMVLARKQDLERQAEARTAAGLDVTLPGRRPWVGRRHVLGQIQAELLELFHGLGYSVYSSPEVELESYNFSKLNFPPDHPARDAHDTYFVNREVLLRTHTSPGWVRAMEQRKPPLRLVFPGRVYRAEHIDATHMDQFHQMDGLFVDRDVSLADLKGTLATFARAIYGEQVRTRFIPVYFPFVEPGAQMDVSCVICGGTGIQAKPDGAQRCVVCKGTGWLEVLGAGMVHPNVFRAVGYDPEEVTGFAFGMGLERIAMLRYGVAEIRLFLENDLRFLGQF
jgi:phenylalanyl-tRNA synthetase alpha chain